MFEIFVQHWNLSAEAPHWTTGRMWLLRVGLYKLTRPKTIADDWVWIVDHTVQIGTEKCLVVLGVRLSELPPVGTCLTLADLEPLHIEPMPKSNSELVHHELESVVEKTGEPRLILDDHGSDLYGGVKLFCQQHPHTSEIYDITHKAARLLKSQLEADELWSRFCTQAGQTKFQTQQTELAFLIPPSQRSKARYMNLGPLVQWGRRTLGIVESPSEEVLQWCCRQRLEEKFGWLRDYSQSLARWSQWLGLVTTAEQLVRREGLSATTVFRLRKELMPLATTGSGARLVGELIAFVAEQCRQVRNEERLVGTTEPLECAFGKLKSLERTSSKTGFTSLLLSLGAVVGKTTAEFVHQALEACRTKHVWNWCQKHL
ncbi:MAG: hypothetical protein B6I33_06360, partial [Propionibacterium sp. 4572_24]